MAKKGEYKIPFDAKGNLLHFAAGVKEWRDNYEFDATLQIGDMRRGYSAKYTLWHDVDDNTRYSMFIADLIDIIRKGANIRPGGEISGRWTFRKRGQNYGIALIEGFPVRLSTLDWDDPAIQAHLMEAFRSVDGPSWQ